MPHSGISSELLNYPMFTSDDDMDDNMDDDMDVPESCSDDDSNTDSDTDESDDADESADAADAADADESADAADAADADESADAADADESDDTDESEDDADFVGDSRRNRELLAIYRKDGRRCVAQDFRREYIYGSSMDQKTIVWRPNGTCSWMDKSSGIVWVGVHGTDSVCVVTRTGHLDVTRVAGFLKYLTVETVFRKFRRTVISELEDLASQSRKLRERFGQRIPKPFGVVSVILGTDKVHKESGLEALSDEDQEDKVMKAMPEKVESGKVSRADEMRDEIRKLLWESTPHSPLAVADETKTIKYLQEQMRRDGNEPIQASSAKYDVTEATKFLLEKMEASTVDETVKTAISAFQILFQKEKFKANEIEVSVMDPEYFVAAKEADYKDIYVKHLERSDIEEYLAAINEPSSGSSSSVGSSSRGLTTTFVKESDASDIEEEHIAGIKRPCNRGSGSRGSSSD